MEVSRYQIEPQIEIIDAQPILYLDDLKAVALADLHLGIEAIMSEDGSFSPYNQTKELTKIVIDYLRLIKPKLLILNGDIKHSFHEPTKIENRDVKSFLEAISLYVREIHIIKGNHDLFLSWAIKDIENITFHTESFSSGQYFFSHGDKPLPDSLPEEIKYVVIAHEHPIFSSKVNNLQKIKAPVFLLGPLSNTKAKLIVLPAISSYSVGTPINPYYKDNLLSPILKENAILPDFELFALVEKKEVLHFPSFKLWYK